MAIDTSKTKMRKSGQGTAAGDSSDSVTRTFSVIWQVVSDNPLDEAKVVQDYFETTVGLPWIGDPYQFGNGQHATALCTAVNPVREGMSNVFNVTVEYAEPGSGGGGESQADVDVVEFQRQPPLLRHDLIETGTMYITIPVREATFRGYFRPGSSTPDTTINNSWLNTGTGYRGPVINSAIDPYDPEPEAEIPIDIIRITRNVWPWNDALATTYKNTVNNADVTISKPDYGYTKIIKAFQGRIIDITGSFEIDLEYRQRYWRSTIEVHVNPLGWRLTMIDKGLRRRAKSGDTTDTGVSISSSTASTTGPQLTHIRDAAGEMITTPVLFDGNGKPLTSGTNPVLMKWEHYTEITWEGIPW
jgi:hypothetical protein